jgi:hypothetical protein
MVSAARFLIALDLRVVNIALPPRLHKSLGRPVGMAFTQGGVTGLTATLARVRPAPPADRFTHHVFAN